MIVIMCLDKNNGIRFNNRRQSKDREVIADIVKKYANKTIWMNEYSEELFEEYDNFLKCVDEDYLLNADKMDYCFVESREVIGYMKDVKEIIVYRWDKVYPSDEIIELNGYKIEKIQEIKGYSHDVIQKEFYIKE